MGQIPVSNEEMRTTREAAREMNALLDQLSRGDLKKIVLTKQGKIVGVLMSPSQYAHLISTES